MSSAIAAGYKRGIATIIDANVVTLLTAFILFVLATAGVKGFAFTLGVGTIVSLLTAVVFTQALLGSMSRSRLLRSPSALGAAGEGVRWHFDFMGASRWFFSISGVILLDRRAGAGDQAAQLRHRLRVRHPDQGRRWTSRPTRKACATALDAAGHQRRGDPAGHRPGTRRQRLPDPDRRARPGEVSEAEAALGRRSTGSPTNGFDSTSVGPTFGEQVANSALQGADLLAAGDLRLRRAAVRPEVRGAGADRDLPRHPDHRRRLLADRQRGEQRDGRRLPDHLGLLALRHDHRLRPNTREHAADAAGGVLADRQPLDERGPDPVAGDQLLDPARGRLAARSSAARPCRTSPSRCWSGSSPVPTRRSSSPRRC